MITKHFKIVKDFSMAYRSATTLTHTNTWFANNITVGIISYSAVVSTNSANSNLSHSKGVYANKLTITSNYPMFNTSPCRPKNTTTAERAQCRRHLSRNRINLTKISTKRQPNFRPMIDRNFPPLTQWQARTHKWIWRSQFNWVFTCKLFQRREWLRRRQILIQNL